MRTRTRHQKGYVFKKGGWWYVRFYDNEVQEDGSIARLQVARKVVAISDDYRSKRTIMSLIEELLAPINNGTYAPESTMTLERFVEQNYLPFVASQKRPSTHKGYKDIWEDHLKPRCSAMRLREFRTCDGERLLADIARQKDLSRNSLKHIKSLLSGIFKHAKRLGVLSGVNPMQDVSIPKAKEGNETYAYSLEEVMRIIAVLPEPAATVVAAAAFTGMRRGELRGLRWEDYNSVQIGISQSVWNSHISAPKTTRSKSPVPVITALRRMLDAHRLREGNPEEGLVFRSSADTPLNFENLVNREIKPKLKEAKLAWHGWHAFRRGLATNLYRLGVPDKTIQAILRHSNVSTTMNIYVKSVSADVLTAMQSFEEICTKMQPQHDGAEALAV